MLPGLYVTNGYNQVVYSVVVIDGSSVVRFSSDELLGTL